jgi:DNA polymerase-3 subunit epsilon
VNKAFVRELGAAEYVDGKFVRGGASLFSGGICEPKALEVHGISDQSVKGKPSFLSKTSEFCRFVDENGKVADLLGHNALRYDLPVIRRFVHQAGLSIKGNGPNGEIRVIDTMLIAKRNFQFPNNRLETLCSIFGIDHGHHRALGDAKCTWEVFLCLMEQMQCKDISGLFELVDQTVSI